MTTPTAEVGRSARFTVIRMVVAAAVCATSIYFLVRLGTPRDDPFRWMWAWLICCAVCTLALTLVAIGRAGSRRMLATVIMAGTIACQATAFVTPTVTSTDAYHYVWDGRVSMAGVSPYRYVPGDDALARLRDPVLFPGLRPDQKSGLKTVWPLPTDKRIKKLWMNKRWTVLSRPGVPTIYPPVAQAYFAGIAAVTPWSAGTLGTQLAAALLAIAVTVLLLWLTARLQIDPRWVVLWGWTPMTAVEATANGHVDILAAFFVVCACATAALGRRRRSAVATGVLLGLAVGVKIFPIALLAAFVSLRDRAGWRRAWLVLAGLVAVLVAFYLPHVLAVGDKVIGYFGGYFADQGYSETSAGVVRRFGVLQTLGVPENLLYPVAALVVLVTAIAILATADPRRPWIAGTYLLGVAFLLATPSYPWYMLVLTPLIVLARRPEWLAVPIAAGAGYVAYPNVWVVPIVYSVAAAVVLAVSLIRAIVAARRRLYSTTSEPTRVDEALT